MRMVPNFLQHKEVDRLKSEQVIKKKKKKYEKKQNNTEGHKRTLRGRKKNKKRKDRKIYKRKLR